MLPFHTAPSTRLRRTWLAPETARFWVHSSIVPCTSGGDCVRSLTFSTLLCGVLFASFLVVVVLPCVMNVCVSTRRVFFFLQF